MTPLEPGHFYKLESLEGSFPQLIRFIEKAEISGGQFATVNDGTTNEEVLKMLIDRVKILNQKLPCAENEFTIQHLEEALTIQESRTRKRINQDVEGTIFPHNTGNFQ